MSEDVMDSGRLVGGFGSAGAGNRTGRSIMTKGGRATNPSERDRRSTKRSRECREGLPTADELRSSLDAGKCWWCGAETSVNGKPFRHMGGHIARGHHIDLQVLRDILGVRKDQSFLSDETKALLSEHAKRHYDPTKLKTRPGLKRELSKYGLESLRIRGLRAWRIGLKAANSLSHTERSEACKRGAKTMLARNPNALAPLIAAGRANAKASRKEQQCVSCGVTFYRPSRLGWRETCSKACDSERRRKAMLENHARKRASGYVWPKTEWTHEFVAAQKTLVGDVYRAISHGPTPFTAIQGAVPCASPNHIYATLSVLRRRGLVVKREICDRKWRGPRFVFSINKIDN